MAAQPAGHPRRELLALRNKGTDLDGLVEQAIGREPVGPNAQSVLKGLALLAERFRRRDRFRLLPVGLRAWLGPVIL